MLRPAGGRAYGVAHDARLDPACEENVISPQGSGVPVSSSSTPPISFHIVSSTGRAYLFQRLLFFVERWSTEDIDGKQWTIWRAADEWWSIDAPTSVGITPVSKDPYQLATWLVGTLEAQRRDA